MGAALLGSRHDGGVAPTRTFVAIALPDSVRSGIGSIVAAQRREGPAGLRWANARQAHLTLAFLGDLDADALQHVRSCVRGVARASAPVPSEVCGAGAFPRADAARVLWLGWGVGADALTEAHEALRVALRSAGVAVKARRFTPHVTIARARVPLDLRAHVAVLRPWRSEPWIVTSFDVMASRLTPAGPEHIQLERCVLAPDSL